MSSSSGQAQIGTIFKWLGYFCFAVAMIVMFYHDSRHLPSRSIGAVFFGVVPGIMLWLVGWAIQRNAKSD